MSSVTRDLVNDLTASRPEFRLQKDFGGAGCGLAFAQAPTTLRELVGRLRDHGAGVALESDGSVVTYAVLWTRIVACAHWLTSRNVRRGDRVAVVARNDPATPAIFWASQSIGAVFVPLNPFWTRDELSHALADCEPAVVFAHPEVLEKLPSPWDSRSILINDHQTESARLTWAEVSCAADNTDLPEAAVIPDDPATLIYTSGTTGRARGVIHTHRNHGAAIQNASITSAAVQQMGTPASTPAPTAAPVVLHVLPWFHVAGVAAIYTSLLGGARNVVMRRWDAAEAARVIEARSVTSIGLVPTMLAQLIRHVRENGADLRSLSLISSGAAAVPTSLLNSAAAVTASGTRLLTGYGLTETTASIAFVLGQDLFDRPESVGLPYPVNRIRLVDQAMEDVESGEAGEIWVSGPTVAAGYWRDQESTQRAFIDGGFRTGDLGRWDQDGYLYIVGRIKDVIIRGGENIQAAEIESVIAELEEVMEVAVLGVAHPTLGEEVVAVVTKDPAADLTDARLEQHCRSRLPIFKIPSRFVSDLDIPRNATGKPVKDILRRFLESGG